MPVGRVAGAFNHREWIFELKHEGFRALAQVDGHHCTLVSRRRHVYKQFPMLLDEIAHSVRCMSCVLDGEVVCPAADGARCSIGYCFGATARTSSRSMCCRSMARTGAVRRSSSVSAGYGPSWPRIASRLVYHDHIDAF
jgi:ATP-dependent DNA ligase